MARRAKTKIRSAERMAMLMAAVIRRDFGNGTIPSKFYYEGRFIAELRSSLCLTGWDWPMADQAARNVVAEAHRLARASRPTWAEGQHAATGLEVTRDSVCRQCGVGLRARQVHFCSRKCRWHWWREFNAETDQAA